MVFWVFIWGVGSALQQCKYFGPQQLLKDIYLREGLVGLAFTFWEESWMQLESLSQGQKAGSGQGTLLLSFSLLSD